MEFLSKCQKDATFNTKVMLNKNSKFLDDHLEDWHLLRKKEAEERTKKLLQQRAAASEKEDRD